MPNPMKVVKTVKKVFSAAPPRPRGKKNSKGDKLPTTGKIKAIKKANKIQDKLDYYTGGSFYVSTNRGLPSMGGKIKYGENFPGGGQSKVTGPNKTFNKNVRKATNKVDGIKVNKKNSNSTLFTGSKNSKPKPKVPVKKRSK
jgi:hypothetical protein